VGSAPLAVLAVSVCVLVLQTRTGPVDLAGRDWRAVEGGVLDVVQADVKGDGVCGVEGAFIGLCLPHRSDRAGAARGSSKTNTSIDTLTIGVRGV